MLFYRKHTQQCIAPTHKKRVGNHSFDQILLTLLFLATFVPDIKKDSIRDDSEHSL